jgi:hypothetical protein
MSDQGFTMDDPECPWNSNTTESLLSRTACILTYGGSPTDLWINYLLLGANCFWCLQVIFRKNALLPPPRGATLCRVGCFLGVIFFQVGLCLQVGCSGISIVWCALAGWALRQEVLLYPQELMQDLRDNRNHNYALPLRGGRWGWIVDINDKIWPNAAALLYYAVVAPPITTVAHSCALVLGYGISKVESSCLGGDPPTTSWEDVLHGGGPSYYQSVLPG